MKKTLIILLSLGLLLSAFSVSAADTCADYCDDLNDPSIENPSMPSGTVCYCNPLGNQTGLDAITGPIINFIFNLSIVVVPVLMISGAFLITTAGGNQERIDQGKKMIFWTLIGFLIVLLSRGLSDLLYGLLGI